MDPVAEQLPGEKLCTNKLGLWSSKNRELGPAQSQTLLSPELCLRSLPGLKWALSRRTDKVYCSCLLAAKCGCFRARQGRAAPWSPTQGSPTSQMERRYLDCLCPCFPKSFPYTPHKPLRMNASQGILDSESHKARTRKPESPNPKSHHYL